MVFPGDLNKININSGSHISLIVAPVVCEPSTMILSDGFHVQYILHKKTSGGWFRTDL